MCWYHNDLDARDAVFNHIAQQNGWSIPRWVANQGLAHLVPVRYGSDWYLMRENGERDLIHDDIARMMISRIYGKEGNQ